MHLLNALKEIKCRAFTHPKPLNECSYHVMMTDSLIRIIRPNSLTSHPQNYMDVCAYISPITWIDAFTWIAFLLLNPVISNHINDNFHQLFLAYPIEKGIFSCLIGQN